MYGSNGKQKTYSLSPIGRRCPVCVVVGSEDKHRNNKCSSPPPSLAFLADQVLCGMGYPFGQFGLAVLAIFPPRILPIAGLLVRGECWRDSLDAVRALLSSSLKAGVLPAPF